MKMMTGVIVLLIMELILYSAISNGQPVMKVYALHLFYMSAILACTPADPPSNINDIQDKGVSQQVALSEGLQLLKTYCYACHNPASPSHDEILAPPMAAVKNRYNVVYPSRTMFIDSMTAFLQDPKKENAIMYGAVQKFGVMVKMPMDESKIRELVAFIYDSPLEEPAWFREHYRSQRGNRGW